jgi:hypothetical protein
MTSWNDKDLEASIGKPIVIQWIDNFVRAPVKSTTVWLNSNSLPSFTNISKLLNYFLLLTFLFIRDNFHNLFQTFSIFRSEDEENEHYERLCRGEKLRVRKNFCSIFFDHKTKWLTYNIPLFFYITLSISCRATVSEYWGRFTMPFGD